MVSGASLTGSLLPKFSQCHGVLFPSSPSLGAYNPGPRTKFLS